MSNTLKSLPDTDVSSPEETREHTVTVEEALHILAAEKPGKPLELHGYKLSTVQQMADVLNGAPEDKRSMALMRLRYEMKKRNRMLVSFTSSV